MNRRIKIAALLCVIALLLSACGGKSSQKEKAPEPTSHEITWIEASFGLLHYKRPDTMTEIPFTPRYGTEGVAYGISNEEGKFFGFTIEKISCTPGDFDSYYPEVFLAEYFPDHWEEYSIAELGDKETGHEIARYNGTPVFCRGAEDLSGEEGVFQYAEYMLEYLVLDEGNNRSFVYIITEYDNYEDYPGTYDFFGYDFTRSFTFDSAAAKAEDLASEDNSMLEAEGTVFEPVRFVLGNYPQYDIPPYYMTVVGAEFFRHDGKEAIRILYDVTNADAGYQRMWQAYEYFSLTATQDGEQLSATWEYEANEKDVGYDGSNPEVLIDRANFRYDNEYSNNRRCIMHDGFTVRTAEEFLCDWQGGPITLRISLPIFNYNLNFYAEDDPLMVELRENCVKEITFAPADLPCKIKNEDWLIPVENPAWSGGIPEEGDIFPDNLTRSGHVKLGNAEFAEVDGTTHMLLHLEYTNLANCENSVFELLAIPVWKSGMADGIPHLWVMQDGVSLSLVETEVTKQGHYQRLQSGETAEYVLEYILRTDSPIEVEANYPPVDASKGLYDGKAAAKVYRP